MKMRVKMVSKAGQIWRDPTSVGRKPRRANGSANPLGPDRAGFEPRRGRDLNPDCARIQTLVSRQSSMNAHSTPRLKSGAESTLGDTGDPGRAEIFALPALKHLT
jgi:hypothetical protein